METRNILDSNGNVIGELSLPLDTPEEVWTERLSTYTYVVPTPPAPTITQIVDAALARAQTEGARLIAEFKRSNVLLGISQAGKTREVADYCHKMNHYLEQGSLYAAMEQLEIMLADPARPNLSPFITDAVLIYYHAQLQSYLGVS